MAQLQTTGVPIHCGYSIEKGIAIISDHEHRLSQSNVVSIDIGWKVVNGKTTDRPALKVGVIKKGAQHVQDHELLPREVRGQVKTSSGEELTYALETDVVEEGVFHDLVAYGGNQVSAIPDWNGILGVNITYHGKYRTLSNAHIFTRFDPNGIGNEIQYRPDPSASFTKLFPVTGQVAVTYYTDPNQQNPIYNFMDIAWGDVTDPALVSTTINAVGGVSIQTSGKIRSPYGGEEFKVGNYRLNKSAKITSLIASYRSKGIDSSGATIYTWWKNGIAFANPGLQAGDSGTAMVASSDQYVIGLVKSASATTAVGCLI